MRVLVGIDDTDNLESKGTGHLAFSIAAAVEGRGWGKGSRITRHQLLVHPDVPYTSHNSAMCFETEMRTDFTGELIRFASDFLERESADGSDPGLCVAAAERLGAVEPLVHFGMRAKASLVTKTEAYELAGRLKIHLSEHGGTGHGVIGALAGVGLRLGGNDGRFRGKVTLQTESGMATVRSILDQTGFDRVKDIHGDCLGSHELVRLPEPLKAVLLDGQSTLLVYSEADERTGRRIWVACPKQQVKMY